MEPTKKNIELFKAVGIHEGAWILDDSYEDWKDWFGHSTGRERCFSSLDEIGENLVDLVAELTDEEHLDLLVIRLSGHCPFCDKEGDVKQGPDAICPHLQMEGVELHEEPWSLVLHKEWKSGQDRLAHAKMVIRSLHPENN